MGLMSIRTRLTLLRGPPALGLRDIREAQSKISTELRRGLQDHLTQATQPEMCQNHQFLAGPCSAESYSIGLLWAIQTLNSPQVGESGMEPVLGTTVLTQCSYFTDQATRQDPTSQVGALKERAFLLSHKHFLTCYCAWKNGMPGLAAKAASDPTTPPRPLSLPIRKPMAG